MRYVQEMLSAYDREGTPPRTQRSVVAFFDILGFRQLHFSACREGRQDELLQSLQRALADGFEWLDPKGGSKLVELPSAWDVKAFTDNIVLGYPFNDEGEGALGGTFIQLSHFQAALVQHGFFVRGGLTVGDLYMDRHLVFGGGLLEAVALENEVARVPRIVLSSAAVELMRQHLEYYGGGEHAPQNDEVLLDSDGVHFLSYLDGSFLEPKSHHAVLERHRLVTREALERHKSSPSIWSKYAWVAEYHNLMCDEREVPDLKIDDAMFRRPPRRMFERPRGPVEEA
jgi:hypothetical protein